MIRCRLFGHKHPTWAYADFTTLNVGFCRRCGKWHRWAAVNTFGAEGTISDGQSRRLENATHPQPADDSIGAER